MQPIRTLIVDDEPLARENLRIRLQRVSDFTVEGECANGREAVEAIRKLRPEVVFLDIRMPDMDGFAVIDEVLPEEQPVVVFVTAFDRYALDAFRVHALDYLLKPFEDERFSETLAICRERVEQRRRPSGAQEMRYQLAATSDLSTVRQARAARPAAARCLERLVIKARGRVFFLKTAHIDWIEAHGDYARIHAGQRSYLLRKTMNELETRLDPRCFPRINRSAIVNMDKILELKPAARGEFRVRLAGGTQLKLTRSYREKLEGMLGDSL